MKKSEASARNGALWLGFLGAASSTLAGSVAALDPKTVSVGAMAPLLGVFAAVAIALAGYVGRELLSPTREDEWVRCRALAEALKQEVFKASMQVPPYTGREASDALRDRVVALLQNTGLVLDPLPASDADAGNAPPKVDSIDDYVANRVREQIDTYYVPALEQHKKKLQSYRLRIFGLGAAATILSTASAVFPRLALVVPVITTATAALATVIQASRLQGIVPLFQETASQLRLVLASWEDDAPARAASTEVERKAAEIAMVVRCEEILGRESEAWRAEWKRGEPKSSVEEFLKQTQSATQAKTGTTA